MIVVAAGLSCVATSAPARAQSPRLNETWRLEAHNSFWHGSNLGADPFASGPKQHLLDDLFIDRMRGLELDLHSHRPGHVWRVYHTSFDAGYSFCEVFDDCLRVIRAFHFASRGHDVFFLHLEAKETGTDSFFDFDQPDVVHLAPEDLDATLMRHLGSGTPPYDDNWVFGPTDLYDWCEDRIAAGELPPGTTLDPDDLKDTVRKCGWPTLDELRGKFVVTLHGNHTSNEDYVHDYSHRDGRRIRNMKIFPMASAVGLSGLSCSDPGQGGVCNWDPHTVFADVLNLNGADFSTDGPFDNDPSFHIRQFLADGGMIRSNDRNSTTDMADAVRTVHDLDDAHGYNVVATDAPRNMLVNFQHANLASGDHLDGPLDWATGCLFEPGTGTNADQGFFGYFDGCSPADVKEENSGIFVSAVGFGSQGLGGSSDTIAFVHTARRAGAGSLRAFVSTRTEETQQLGPSHTGNWGCLMAREDAATPDAPFFAVCRREHRNSWATEAGEAGAYVLYRTAAGFGTASVYYDQPNDGHGVAEIQNFFRLGHSADGRCWSGFIQSTDDPRPAAGWAEGLLGSEVCFANPLGFVGLATDGGGLQFNPPRGEYLFANVRYGADYLRLSDLVIPGLIQSPGSPMGPVLVLERTLLYDRDGDTIPDWEEDVNGNGVVDPGETDPASSDSDGDGLSDTEEIALGTSPTNADSDGDGLPDGEELALGTDPLNPDSDGDGYRDGAEADAGCAPLEPTEIPTQPVVHPGAPGEWLWNGLIVYGAPAANVIDVATDPSCATLGSCGANGFCSRGRMGDACTADANCDLIPGTCRLLLDYADVSDLAVVQARLNRTDLQSFSPASIGCARKIDVQLDPLKRTNRLRLKARGTVAGRTRADVDVFRFRR